MENIKRRRKKGGFIGKVKVEPCPHPSPIADKYFMERWGYLLLSIFLPLFTFIFKTVPKFARYLYAVILFVHFTAKLSYIDLFLNPQQKLNFNANIRSTATYIQFQTILYERSNDNKKTTVQE